MKSILFLLAFALLGSMTLLKDAPCDPIASIDIKLGRKTGDGIIATTQTAADGTFEFSGLEPGDGYYLEFGIKEKGIRAGSMPTVIENLCACGTVNTATNRAKLTNAPINKVFGDATVTVTMEAGKLRGIINTSRDNIKK